MNRKQFFKRLEEDKYFDNYVEYTKYRLETVQYYLTNIAPEIEISKNIKLSSNLIKLKEPKTNKEREEICKLFNDIKLELIIL